MFVSVQIFSYLLISFLGFAFGRFSHICAGRIKVPHCWVYGVIIMFLGIAIDLFLFEDTWSLHLIALGLGLAISDIEDMAEFKIYGLCSNGKKKFWGID